MSDIMERTLASIPRLLSSAFLGGGKSGQQGNVRRSQPSLVFQNLVKAVNMARNHSELATVVRAELARMKQLFQQQDASVNQWCENFPQIIFLSILGFDVSFSHIYALKLAAQGKGRQKRTGYLAATLLIDPTTEIAILMMGTLTRDLESSNILDNLMALGAAAELVKMEHIPMMLPHVVKLLRHQQAIVRAKALNCIHAFFRHAPSLMQHVQRDVKSMLGDRDPGVLSATVTTLSAMMVHHGDKFRDLGKALVNILIQVRGYKFPATFNYHGLPLPWLQITLLKILARLGALDDELTSTLAPILSHMVRDTRGKEPMSLAILEETMLTIVALARPERPCEGEEDTGEDQQRADIFTDISDGSNKAASAKESLGQGFDVESSFEVKESFDDRSIDHHRLMKLKPLLEEASKCVGSFLISSNPNLRFLGVKVLTQLVSVDPDLAVSHKTMVIKFLRDPDLIIRRQTLNLLHHMANPDNVKVICTTMMNHVQGGSGGETDVIDMVVELCNRLNPDPEWYLHTIFPLFPWNLDFDKLSSGIDCMLKYFARNIHQSQYPTFPESLFNKMSESLADCEDSNSPLVQFCFKVLRFIPLPVGQVFSSHKFLAACARLLTDDKQTVVIKKQVVMCVQTLFLRGVIDKSAVSSWAQDVVQQSDLTSHCPYLCKLSELLRLASLDINLSRLSVQKSVKETDLTLSFLDSYSSSKLKHGQPFFKTQHSAEAPAVDAVLDGSALLKQGGANKSVSTSHSQDSPLYGTKSECAVSGMDESAPSTSLQSGFKVKQRWTKQGFDFNASEGPQSREDNITEEDNVTQSAEVHEEDHDDILALELFQGLSPKPVLTSATVAGSHKSSTSSGFDSSSSHNSNSAGKSCYDMSRNIKSDQDLFQPGAVTPSNQATDSSNSSQLPEHLESEIAQIFTDNDNSLSSPTSMLSSSSSWKVLHTSYLQETLSPDRDLESGAVLGEKFTMSVGSESNLSLSDDSLENSRSHSLSTSPSRHPGQIDSHVFDEDKQDNSDADNVLSEFLDAHMNETEDSSPQAGGNSEASGGDSLYSGFEMLAQSPTQFDSKGDISEASYFEMSNSIPEAEMFTSVSPDKDPQAHNTS